MFTPKTAVAHGKSGGTGTAVAGSLRGDSFAVVITDAEAISAKALVSAIEDRGGVALSIIADDSRPRRCDWRYRPAIRRTVRKAFGAPED